MSQNQYLILTGVEVKKMFINISNITHIIPQSTGTAIYVVGNNKPILVQETMQDLESLLPDMIQISKVC